MKLQGKTALVTGSARRVGKQIALALAKRGCHIILHYNRSRKEAQAAAREIASLGVRVTLFQADLGKIPSLERKARALLERSRPIHILVNNASSFYQTPFGRITEKEWDDLVNSNLKGPFFLTQIIGRSMLQHGGGKIVNIGDWSALRPYKNFLPYSIAKSGVLIMTQILAKTLAPSVQVNAVSPGAVLLPKNFDEKSTREVIRKTPLGKIGSPEDIAAGVLFFLEGTDFATGANLVIDGGQWVQ
ncbi:MAG: SDR family NAD(P)-dependent oxidoreductase [Candidatus Omnitrophica bacterium]|nr:SDR family NAD(P)-dependent oxidoreductase [Candidatus Omnitrophota bacterium]